MPDWSESRHHSIHGKFYARLEALEGAEPSQTPLDREGARHAVVAFDAVRADWIDSCQDPFFAFDEGLEERVKDYWGGLSPSSQSDPPDDPYERVPVFHIEASGAEHPWIAELPEVRDLWVELHLSASGEHEVDVFRGLFDPEPEVALISDAPRLIQNSKLSMQLSTAFDMKHWPDASDAELEGLFSSIPLPPIEQLISFDVGQGTASCLACDCGLPICYFDLGCGVYRNARIRPHNIQFCNCSDPPIILSHWDEDHWAGADRDPKCLQATWVAPRQKIGPRHTTFASRILQQRGSILIVPAPVPVGATIVTWNGPCQEITLSRATGRGRNDSGLVMQVWNRCEDKNWLLAGDADYQHIPNLPCESAAISVPHHGATKCRVSPPAPSDTGESRLLYSFGPGNKHGRYGVSHPRRATVDAHVKAGWRSPGWTSGTPGDAVAHGTTLATAQHPSTHLGWVAAGWDRKPTRPGRLMRCLGVPTPPQT